MRLKSAKKHINKRIKEGLRFMAVIAKGKTKTVETTNDEDEVLITNRDDITAQDGLKHDFLKGKARHATRTTCNIFKFLEGKGIPTHFIKQRDETSFYARRATMLPLEFVARGRAKGSYLKRNPEVPEDAIFDRPVLEYHVKDDRKHDPLMLWDNKERKFKFYDAQRPVSKDSYMPDVRLEDYLPPGVSFGIQDSDQLFALLRRVFIELERAWRIMGIILYDIKIEFGRNSKGQWIVADVIDNDSWRIRVMKDGKILDKDVYRKNLQSMEEIGENYALVAELTETLKNL